MKMTAELLRGMFALVVFTPMLAQTSSPIGSIDGQPLVLSPDIDQKASVQFQLERGRPPAGVADITGLEAVRTELTCAELTSQINVAIERGQMSRFHVTVTDGEAIQAAAAYWTEGRADREVDHIRTVATAILDGLVELHDRHNDPKQVFERFGAPLGLPREVWDIYMRQYEKPEDRGSLGRQRDLDSTRIPVATQTAIQRILEKQKLDGIIDAEIAKQDPTFQRYLEIEQQATALSGPFEKQTQAIPSTIRDYLESKRLAWWKSRAAEMSVFVDSPNLAENCRLAELGVRVNGR